MHLQPPYFCNFAYCQKNKLPFQNWYDADGERTMKTSGEGEQLYVNSEFAGGRTNTAKFSLYVSPYLVANPGGRYTFR